MQFILVKDGYLELGPREWNYRIFKNELEDLEFPDKVIPVNNTEYLDLGDGIEIYLAEILPINYNPDIEELSGPYWEYSEGKATGSYTTVPLDIQRVRNNFKNKIAAERYRREVSGTVCSIQGVEVEIDTSRDGRNIYVQKYLLMGDSDIVNWKFNSGFKGLTKEELGQMIQAGIVHIQGAFDWESELVDRIELSGTAEEIKGIYDGIFV